MKTQNNSNLTLSEALNLVVGNIVKQTINNQTTVSNDSYNINNSTPLNISKKNIMGTVTSNSEESSFVTLDDDSVIEVKEYVQDGIVQTPKIGSRVLIGFDNENDPFFLRVYDPFIISIRTIDGEGIVLQTDNTQDRIITTITIVNDTVRLNGGEYGGLIKIQELTDQLNKLTTDFNNLVNLFNNHIHVTTATIGATPTPGIISPTSTKGQQTSTFNIEDYENKTVVHGPNNE